MRTVSIVVVMAFAYVAMSHQGHAQDFSIRISLVNTCLESLPKEDQSKCVGKAAQACMSENNGGETTVGMSSCTALELDWWDAKLNQAYSKLSKREKKDDAEAKTYQLTVPAKAPALRDMQRAWISYRDRLCEYEASQWGGGTGSGPAYLSCTLSETARQFFVLNRQIGAPQ